MSYAVRMHAFGNIFGNRFHQPHASRGIEDLQDLRFARI